MKMPAWRCYRLMGTIALSFLTTRSGDTLCFSFFSRFCLTANTLLSIFHDPTRPFTLLAVIQNLKGKMEKLVGITQQKPLKNPF